MPRGGGRRAVRPPEHASTGDQWIPTWGIVSPVADLRVYTVPGMSCEHCEAALTEEVSAVAGVDRVEVDLATKLVTVHGTDLDDARLRDAIAEAGYEAA
jgi:copper chaperone